MVTPQQPYGARLEIDYPEQLDRLTTFFRLIWIIPIMIVLSLVSAATSWTVVTDTGETITGSSGGIAAGLFTATALMILFRQRYPRWWFDFARELPVSRRGSSPTWSSSPINILQPLRSSRCISTSTIPTSSRTSIAGCLW